MTKARALEGKLLLILLQASAAVHSLRRLITSFFKDLTRTVSAASVPELEKSSNTQGCPLFLFFYFPVSGHQLPSSILCGGPSGIPLT